MKLSDSVCHVCGTRSTGMKENPQTQRFFLSLWCSEIWINNRGYVIELGCEENYNKTRTCESVGSGHVSKHNQITFPLNAQWSAALSKCTQEGAQCFDWHVWEGAWCAAVGDSFQEHTVRTSMLARSEKLCGSCSKYSSAIIISHHCLFITPSQMLCIYCATV